MIKLIDKWRCFVFQNRDIKPVALKIERGKKERKKKKNEKRRQRGTLRTRKKEDLYFAGFK